MEEMEQCYTIFLSNRCSFSLQTEIKHVLQKKILLRVKEWDTISDASPSEIFFKNFEYFRTIQWGSLLPGQSSSLSDVPTKAVVP